jgi:hypothetical protein
LVGRYRDSTLRSIGRFRLPSPSVTLSCHNVPAKALIEAACACRLVIVGHRNNDQRARDCAQIKAREPREARRPLDGIGRAPPGMATRTPASTPLVWERSGPRCRPSCIAATSLVIDIHRSGAGQLPSPSDGGASQPSAHETRSGASSRVAKCEAYARLELLDTPTGLFISCPSGWMRDSVRSVCGVQPDGQPGRLLILEKPRNSRRQGCPYIRQERAGGSVPPVGLRTPDLGETPRRDCFRLDHRFGPAGGAQ